MKKPVIGIFSSPLNNPHPSFRTIPCSGLNIAYSEAVIRNGGIPLIFPYTFDASAIREMIDQCDGVIIPGGVDVDPRYFGEDPHPEIGVIDPDLDAIQMMALAYMEEKQMPVLGICRGCQIMNVYAGGSIYQDLAAEYEGKPNLHAQKEKRSYAIHKVQLEEGSYLRELLGEESIYTNSMHHQAVHQVGKNLRVVARTADGVVEAIEHDNGIWLATQWHPEELVDSVPQMNRIFADLIEKAAQRH